MLSKKTLLAIRAAFLLTLFLLLPESASAQKEDSLVLVGDPVNGKKLFKKHCADCHGARGRGGRIGVALTDSGRLNLVRNHPMFEKIKTGRGSKKPKEHRFKDKLTFLEIWDCIGYVRSIHMTIADFFPKASRYVSKEYTIDKHGLERLKERTGKSLRDKKAAVFTFFEFDGEEGAMTYIPQDPIKLDQLNKKNKVGYIVFLPFRTDDGFSGEIGVGMDSGGRITKIMVHPSDPDAELLNKSLSRFEGMGKKNQIEPFKVGGGKKMAELAEVVFPTYMRAMETATMYDREENERTWADP